MLEHVLENLKSVREEIPGLLAYWGDIPQEPGRYSNRDFFKVLGQKLDKLIGRVSEINKIVQEFVPKGEHDPEEEFHRSAGIRQQQIPSKLSIPKTRDAESDESESAEKLIRDLMSV